MLSIYCFQADIWFTKSEKWDWSQYDIQVTSIVSNSYGTPVGSENSHYVQSQFVLDFLQAL